MALPDYELTTDANFKVYFKYHCPECLEPNRIPLTGLKTGSVVSCMCGYASIFSREDLRRAQGGLDDLRMVLKKVRMP
jgi:hypothetical protein